jgi:hypothetical protein
MRTLLLGIWMGKEFEKRQLWRWRRSWEAVSVGRRLVHKLTLQFSKFCLQCNIVLSNSLSHSLIKCLNKMPYKLIRGSYNLESTWNFLGFIRPKLFLRLIQESHDRWGKGRQFHVKCWWISRPRRICRHGLENNIKMDLTNCAMKT